jgi:hypothetical protein
LTGESYQLHLPDHPDFYESFDDPDQSEPLHLIRHFDRAARNPFSSPEYFSDPDVQSFLDDLDIMGAFDWPYYPTPDPADFHHLS